MRGQQATAALYALRADLKAAREQRDTAERTLALEREHSAQLRQRNAELAAANAGLRAQLDAQGDHAVYIVPGTRYFQGVHEHLHEAVDGDVLRNAETGEELVLRDGTWQRKVVLHLSTGRIRRQREKIMAEKPPAELKPLGIQGIVWYVTVTERGYFTATTSQLPGDTVTLHSDSYDDLERKASQAVSRQKVRISVPYARLADNGGGRNRPDEWILGEATGVHGSTGNVLYREGTSTGQMSGYLQGYIRRPEAEDAARALAILAEQRGLAAELKAIKEKYAFNGGIDKEVRRVLAGEKADDAAAQQ